MPDRLTTFPVVATKLELRRQSFFKPKPENRNENVPLDSRIEKYGDIFFGSENSI